MPAAIGAPARAADVCLWTTELPEHCTNLASETRAVGKTIALSPYFPRIFLGAASFALAAVTLVAAPRARARNSAA